MSHWPCFEDNGWIEKTGCGHEIVFVWNAINKNATENNNYQSEEEQRAYFLQLLVELRDRMDSGCVYVGLIKYGSCAYIRHELSNDYESVRDQIMYKEGADPSVDSAGLGDGYSNLLAAYYQIYEVLNNPATSKPPGPVYPYQTTKHVVMSVYDVWGLDWAANHPNSQSMPVNAATGNPGFTATQPDDHQILYDPASYPAPTYHMNPMSWATSLPVPALSPNQVGPWPQSGQFNTVDWARTPGSVILFGSCVPDMGQAQTWFMNNIHPTLHGQVENYPGPSGSASTTCNNCYQYDYIHPDSLKPNPTYTGVIPFLPTHYNSGDMWYFVMDNQMEAIQIQYDALYGQNYNANDDPITPGANWPPLHPASRNYFEDTYLKANQCGNGLTQTGIWDQESRRGDGIYLPTDDFGGGATGEYFLNVVTAFKAGPINPGGPPTVRGSYPLNKGVIAQGLSECSSSLLGEWVCPPGYDLILREGEHICCLLETTEPIIEDQYLPISLDDEFYFKDISWTVSYDPKSQAWMSFHDWHPELCLPSINHFMTTKTFLGDRDEGSIWKHNQRCDSFVNYYGEDYPWEVELVESTGQAVNTVRNLEYQLESYVYKGNKLNPFQCGDDRWHDLNWNFDEAIIYNTEQVSGLLKLNLNPQSDPITALQYPIINAADIDILYTKEEQKYRLNQFWDITKDRGEFTNVEQQIFLTQLNGYIRDLNAANLDYNKAPTQRKKFRHYYNKAILRRRISGNRKMLLKLVNTKLNLSFR
tara:strand:- start:81307 stop:83580 length:2274 start_codon:yes stop_codon:yes gene_type:complete